MSKQKAVHPAQKKAKVKKADATGSSDYMAAVQTFEDFNYNFTYTSGMAYVYPIKVSRNGNTVVFSDLLNYDEMQAYYGYVGDDVTGTYDPEAKTITLPTPHQDGNSCTIVGHDDYSNYAIMAGRLDENSEFWPEDNLVFHVVGDFERIYTTQHIGVVTVVDGETGYLAGSFATLNAQPSDSPHPILALPSEIELGKTFPENELTSHIQLVNLGTENVTFAMSLPAGTEGLTLEPAMGEIYSGETFIIDANYMASNAGAFSLPATLAYETAQGEAELKITLNGEVEPFPDFSPIVKAGEISFATGYDYPFVIQGEETKAAVSTAKDFYKTSWLEARVNVPEGHSGKLAYKGKALCTDAGDPYAGHKVSIYVDDAEEPAYTTSEDADLDSLFELEPGDHKVRFEFRMGMNYNPDAPYGLTLNELSFSTEMAAAEGVEVLTPAVDFGGLLLDGANVTKTANVELRNTGSTPLKATGFKSSNPAFTAELPSEEASLLGVLSVPVTLTATEPGTYESTFTIETSAGAVEATATALVRQMPDFSKILDDKDGVVKITTDMNHPFMMSEDGTKAYNANAGENDNAKVTSKITFTVTVPDNKVAHVSWNALCSTDEADRVLVHIDGPSGFDYDYLSGEMNADSQARYEHKERYLEMVPGTHTVDFEYTKNGDGTIGGSDIFSISKFTAKVEDFDTKAYSLDRTKVRFADCIIPEGEQNLNKSMAIVNIMNEGSDELRVLDTDEIKDELPDNGSFGYRNPGYVVCHGQALMVDIVFYPNEEGNFTNTITIPTTFGNLTVEAEGRAYTSDGMFLLENMDDETTRWTFVDKDGDENNWFRVADKYYFRPLAYCFSGDNALMSYSQDGGDELKPDNYAISPEFTVPADGGILSWWVATVENSSADESYEVSIIPADEYDRSKLGSYPVAFSETLKPENKFFKESSLDLATYAGKKVRVAFRHNTANGKGGIRLDDVYGFTNAKWNKLTTSVTGIESDAEVVSVEYFNLAGVRVSENASGILIKRALLKDGSVKVQKIYNR